MRKSHIATLLQALRFKRAITCKYNYTSRDYVLFNVLLHVEEVESRVKRQQTLRHGEEAVVELDDALQVRQLVCVGFVDANQQQEQVT